MTRHRRRSETFWFYTTLTLVVAAMAFTRATCAKGAEPGQQLLLDFSASWCGPCKTMEPTVAQLVADGYPVRRVDFDSNRELAKQFGVTEIPCFVATVDGREINRIVGACSRESLVGLFRKAAPPPPPAQRPEGSNAASQPDLSACEYRISVPLGVMPDGGRGFNLGSGTAISPRCIVTAAHVVERKHAKQITVTAPDKSQFTGACVAVSPNSDVALVVVTSDLPAYVLLASQDPAKGAAISAVGYGHAGVLRQGGGNVTLAMNGKREIEADVSIQSGDSGGGLFNAAGELCGVLIACDGSESTKDFLQGVLAAEPVSKVKSLCAAYEAQYPNGPAITNQMVPVQPVQPVAPAPVQPAQPQIIYVYPPPGQAAPAPAPAQPVPAPAPAPVPTDITPLEAQIAKNHKIILGKFDDLSSQSSDAQTASAANTKAMLAGQGSVIAGVVAKSLLDAGVTATATTGMPTWIQWVLGILGGSASFGGIGLIGTIILKLLGVVGTAAANPPIDPVVLATNIGAAIQQQINANPTQPGAVSIAAILAAELNAWNKVAPIMQGFNSGVQSGAPTAAAPAPTAPVATG